MVDDSELLGLIFKYGYLIKLLLKTMLDIPSGLIGHFFIICAFLNAENSNC